MPDFKPNEHVENLYAFLLTIPEGVTVPYADLEREAGCNLRNVPGRAIRLKAERRVLREHARVFEVQPQVGTRRLTPEEA